MRPPITAPPLSIFVQIKVALNGLDDAKLVDFIQNVKIILK